ncbi:hypothetical protein HAX54_009651 [Datura stramonium]|uniref:Uncharacterized protein n=1 Tax=Datura stramonium TaxID=4076 RepID=A0ABS8TF30_DATST|nr:hypothetical protein [Datura stramonium]
MEVWWFQPVEDGGVRRFVAATAIAGSGERKERGGRWCDGGWFGRRFDGFPVEGGGRELLVAVLRGEGDGG